MNMNMISRVVNKKIGSYFSFKIGDTIKKYMYNINNISEGTISFGLFNVSLFFFYLFVRNKRNNIIKFKQDPLLLYENKYKQKYNKLETIELDKDDLQNLKNKTIIEYTPKGNVIMYYNSEDNVFNYYCDTKDIPYHYLETIARKYVVQFNCKKIYINMIDHMKTSDEIEDKYKKNKNPLFIDYKFNSKNQSRGGKNDTKKYIVKEKSNRYSYCGKISDFKFLKQHYQKKKFTFADFKKFSNT